MKPSRLLNFRTFYLFTELIMAIQRVKLQFAVKVEFTKESMQNLCFEYITKQVNRENVHSLKRSTITGH